ncbi:MAG: RNA polymerase sigma-I factor [Erysipelotrichaceae bacterium]|jgi:RNA polymerase sigma factor|nr:RNA polymerase sigma-I factor [Bacillota bacterium]NLP22874.1 RNA polymerase sigma-I factor [Erysipelotrichaceae bacterium]HCY05890.1 RNA polymerase sigma-I factor [Erysipelotrichaceae bacterium]
MQNEHVIIQKVYDSKDDMHAADELIREYMPFIKSEVFKFTNKYSEVLQDEHSIAMLAFHEAIKGYSKSRGSFLNYASLLIKSRLIDYQRKEKRHYNQLSLDETYGDEEDTALIDTIPADNVDVMQEHNVQATKEEIIELSNQLRQYGVSLSDVADNSPKQDRTLEKCRQAINYAIENREIIDELLRTKKLPLTSLVNGSNVDRKTLERHRKYIVTMLLIYSNGYEIIRGHLSHIVRKGGYQA